jgi:hypothetical protein
MVKKFHSRVPVECHTPLGGPALLLMPDVMESRGVVLGELRDVIAQLRVVRASAQYYQSVHVSLIS